MTLEALLSHANPVREQTRICAASASILASATMNEAVAPAMVNPVRRRRWRRAITSAVAVAVAVPALAAAVNLSGVHTGFFPTKRQAGAEMIPGLEVLRISDPGIVEFARKATKTVPLPHGSTWQPFLADFPVPKEDGIDVEAQYPLVLEFAQQYAKCQWEITWLNGDSAVRAQTAAGIAQIPKWDVFTKYDKSAAARMRQIADQVQRGQSELLRQDVNQSCGGKPFPF
jgi:hypothetical protein